MSDSNRFVLAAFAGLGSLLCAAAFGAYFGALYSPTYYRHPPLAGFQSSSLGSDKPHPSPHGLSGIPDRVERVIANSPATDDQNQDDRELAAQEAMALWAFWMFTAAVATFGVTSAGTYLIWRQVRLTREAVEDTGKATKAMERQNVIAEDTARRQLRAYIGIEDEEITDFRIGGKGRFSCKIYNRGQTPAYDVRVWSSVIGTYKSPDLEKVRIKKPRHISNVVLGPGQWVLHYSTAEDSITEDVYVEICSGRMKMIFAGIITYRDAFHRRRITTFKTWISGDGKTMLPNEHDLYAALKGNKSN